MRKSALALAALGFVACAVDAHDGDFVDTFGVDGREQIGFAPSLGLSSGFVNFVDLAVQPDGKIVVSATVANTDSDDIGVLRLNPNGTLDTNFGTQGQTIVAFDGGDMNTDVASSVLLQPNGRIVVCGEASGDPSAGGFDFGIVRLTSSGAPDTQFSGDGKATVGFDLGAVGQRADLAVRCSLQSDGKIVAAGQAQFSATNSRMAVARLNADGSRDTGFNGSGTATVDFGPSHPNSNAFSV
ncbi:MAG TPA: delta-60 repeat domain-containing protein, partial [Rhodanobacteraceae bacterium]|nr:delta-60 repeat domain-containing protein [Rhodanobacteraceae bacterium]